MKTLFLKVAGIALALGISSIATAEELTHTILGEGWLNSAQIYNGVTRQEPIVKHRWLQASGFLLGDSVTKGEKTVMVVSGEGTVRFSYYYAKDADLGNWTCIFPTWSFEMKQAYGRYTFFNPEEQTLSFTLGFFPYKYNPDVRNLGEFMFRSTPYPNGLVTYFDQPFARIMGAKISSKLFSGALSQDLILSNEYEYFPTQDFSLAYIAGIHLGPILDLGFGGQLFRLFQVRNPEENEADVDTWFYKSKEDSLSGKKTYYKFNGTKLMGRINVSPLANVDKITLPFIGTLFGKEDLKVYAEANVLGLESYPVYYANSPDNPNRKLYGYYEKLSERIPVTFGINAPSNPLFAYGILPTATFLLAKERSMLKTTSKRVTWTAGSIVATAAALCLQNFADMNTAPDLLNLEFEYSSNPYPNSFEGVYKKFAPIPEWNEINPTFKHNRWRWSVYAMKDMGSFFAKFQVAHDHFRAFIPRADKAETVDNLGSSGLWWWTLKTGFKF